MQTDVFIALINPSMALIFSATFFLLWHRRRQPYIATFGIAFLAVSVGFLLQYFAPLGLQASRLVSVTLFLAGCVGLAAGVLSRHNRRPPLVPLAAIALAGFLSFAWFLFVVPDLNWRILAVNFAVGAMALVLVAELRAVPGRRMIDNLLLGIVFLWGISFFPRPILILWVDGPYTGYAGFHQSLYWITLTLSASIFMLLFALTCITAVALDVMEELQDESHTDPLSGLRNRRGFEEETGDSLKFAQRKGTPATLVVCDLDHFKAVNDTFGHASGDSVIVAFAQCLRACAAPHHIVGRIGGEEFAVLVEDGDAAAARLFSEGARTAFSATPVPGLPQHMRFTASFGVAEWNEGESVASLFSRADRALYEAKKAGRDCVHVAPARSFLVERRRALQKAMTGPND